MDSDLEAWGAAGIVLKGDQDPSLQAVIMAVKSRNKRSAQGEKVSKGSRKSSGAIEDAMELVGSSLFTLHSELGFKLKVKICSESLIMPWLVRRAGYSLTRFATKEDVRTAWEQSGQTTYKSELSKIAESIDYKMQTKDYSKLEPIWHEGISLGERDESDKIIVGTVREIERDRTAKLRNAGEKCTKEVYPAFIGVPWNPGGLEVKDQNEVVRRRRCVTKAPMEEHGPAGGLEARERKSPTHNAMCKARFAKTEDLRRD